MTDVFSQVVSTYGSKFMSEFGLNAVQAAGILGNFAHETGAFKYYQEIGSGPNSGGRGWPMLTGPRRIAFLGYCKAHRLDPKSHDASFDYVRVEFHGAYSNVIVALRRCTSLPSATSTVERLYEAAGIKAMSSRLTYARRALSILSPGHPETVSHAPMAKKAAPRSRHHRHA